MNKLIHDEGVCQELLYNKYVSGKTSSQVQPNPTDSPFRKGLMGVAYFLVEFPLLLAMDKHEVLGRFLA